MTKRGVAPLSGKAEMHNLHKQVENGPLGNLASFPESCGALMTVHRAFLCCVLLIACSCRAATSVDGSGSQPASYVVTGSISGQMRGDMDAIVDARISAFGYFEGDTIARAISGTVSSSVVGAYQLEVYDSLAVASPVNASNPKQWRALLVVDPLRGSRNALTVVQSNSITVSAGAPSHRVVRLDFDIGGFVPGSLPIRLPGLLPDRDEPVDTAGLSDSARSNGADIFVRLTGPVTAPALAMLVDAGLAKGALHSALHVFASGALGTVWGALPAASPGTPDVLENISALPFVIAINPLSRRTGGDTVTSRPSADDEPFSATDDRWFVYDVAGRCYIDNPSSELVVPAQCGTLLVGLAAGVRSSDLVGLFKIIGGQVETDHSLPANGLGWLSLKVPVGTERSARAALKADARIRHVEPNYEGVVI